MSLRQDEEDVSMMHPDGATIILGFVNYSKKNGQVVSAIVDMDYLDWQVHFAYLFTAGNINSQEIVCFKRDTQIRIEMKKDAFIAFRRAVANKYPNFYLNIPHY